MLYFYSISLSVRIQTFPLSLKCMLMIIPVVSLQWRHNDQDGVSNHQPHGCLLNRLFRRRSKKTSKLRVTGLCVGNSPVTGEFPAQRASHAENVSIWWRHHVDSRSFCPSALCRPCAWRWICDKIIYAYMFNAAYLAWVMKHLICGR